MSAPLPPSDRLRGLVRAAFQDARSYDAAIGEVQRILDSPAPTSSLEAIQQNATLREGAHFQARKVAELRVLVQDHIRLIADQQAEIERLRDGAK